jgi:Leucine-rich repeat (LRR) protein
MIDNGATEFLSVTLSDSFPNLLAIKIWRTSLKFVTNNHFKRLYDLTFIHLENNKIRILESEAFRENLKLIKINLGDNDIKYLNKDLFTSLVNLKSLYLYGNLISCIDPQTFKNLSNLELITLSNNEIKFLHPESLKNLTDLKKLFISDNELELIDLKNNKKLEEIFLDFNELKSIDSRMFVDMENLRYVSLYENICIDESYEGSTRMITMQVELEESCSTGNETLNREMQEVKFKLELEEVKKEYIENVRSFKDEEVERCVTVI